MGPSSRLRDTERSGSEPAARRSGRPAWLEIDLDAVEHNARSVKNLIGQHCELMAVVKADGYGLGAPAIARAAIRGGATRLAVALVDEGVVLRRAGFAQPILVMGYASPEEAEAAVSNELTVVISHRETAAALEKAAQSLGLPESSVPVHVKVDTGLHRYGCLPDELMPLLEFISERPHLRIEGLMTHFATADSQDLHFAREQLGLFNDIQSQLHERGYRFRVVHAANSAATLALPESRFDAVRVGIMLTGTVPSPHLQGIIPLREAAGIRSRLARVVEIGTGESVGYGQTWIAPRPSTVGLVPVGYADGYRRAFSNRAQVLVNGVRCPVVGRVSMDQITVDLTDAGSARGNAEVVLLGRQGDEEISAGELAGWADTITYEIFTGLARRLPRAYISSGRATFEDASFGDAPSAEGHSV